MLVVLVFVVMAALIVASSWLAVQDWTRTATSSETKDGADTPTWAALPESLEGVLARQLVDHEITSRQYRKAMHLLAERDADRHPLPDLPGDAPAG